MNNLDRTITLGEINNESACDIIEFIHNVNKTSDNKSPINLLIVSGGGNVYEGLGIIDVIESSKTPIHTYVYGLAQSMSFAISCVGHYRYATKNSTFMYHELSWNTESTKLKQYIDDIEESKRLWGLYDNIILKNTKIKKKQLSKICLEQKDWYINPTEALKLGIIDKIL